MFNLVLLGPPGCGKGTQAQRIVEKYGFLHLSTGNLIREEIQKETKLGKKLQTFVSQGLLVPDDIILKQVWNYALKHEKDKGIIFDGFPRTLYQAIKLDKLFAKKNYSISLVLAMYVPEEVLLQRIMYRAQQEGRVDDNEGVFKNRLLVYYSQTQPVINYYKKKNVLKEIEGNRSIDEVFSDICKAIDEALDMYEREQFH
jgi:adenylate kinase